MKRPAFQFYPADWRNNANLGRCSPAARGIWVDILCVLHDSDEYGVVRWPLADVANAAHAPMKLIRELVDKNVLKGSDKQVEQPYVYTPRSGRRDGPPVTLVPIQAGPVWYSSRMVKDEHVRTIRGESTRFGDESGDESGDEPKPTPKISPKTPLGDGSSSSSSSSPSGINTSGTTYPHPSAVRLNGSHSAGLPGIEARKPAPQRLPDCPHSVLVGLYAKHLPQLRQPKVWTGARAEAMRARWRQGAMPSAFGSGYIDVDGGMRFWDRFFAFVATCPKLVNGIARPDQSRWEPDLPWLMKAENFAKVIEGNYAP